MDEFETAILYSYDPTITGDVKQQAIQYCEQVMRTPDAWVFCLDRFFKTQLIQVKFFCLQVVQDLILHRYNSISDTLRNQLRASLLTWLREYIPRHPNEDHSIKNKYAQTLVLVFRAEYPEQWPTFFHDLLALLPAGLVLIDMFLRVLNTIDEVVVAAELHRSAAELAHNTHIKDYMRAHAVVDLVKTWYELLTTYHSTNPTIAKMCLSNIKNYVEWIDINLIVNDQFIPLFFQFLSNPNLREGVIECFQEIVDKGMEPLPKFALLQQLRINSILAAVQLNDDNDFLTKVGKLLDVVGAELITSCEAVAELVQQQQQQQQQPKNEEMLAASQLLDEALALMFKYLAHDDIGVSSTVLNFLGLYINKLKHGKPSQKQLEHMSLLLQIIRHRMKYPDTYNFTNPDESEKEFNEYRKDLANHFRNVFRISPEILCNFVHSSITAVLVSPHTTPHSDVEVALYLLFQLGEGLSASGEEILKMMEAFLTQEITLIASTNISAHPHQCVTLMYFETIARYAKNIPTNNQQLLINIITSFLDNRGIRHPQFAVRKRVCQLLRQFTKTQRLQLYPYLDNIIDNLKELLVISFEVQKSVPFEEQLNFYESLGILIGTNPNAPQQPKHIAALIGPAIVQMEEILNKELYKSDLVNDKPYYTVILSQLITVIGNFSKGFSALAVPRDLSGAPAGSPSSSRFTPTSPPTAAGSAAAAAAAAAAAELTAANRRFFISALEVILRVPELMPAHEELREKVFFYMHRMVECLGSALTPYLPRALSSLLASASAHNIKDLMEFITLINQLISRLKETLFPLMDEMFFTILAQIVKFLQPTHQLTPNSEEQREIFELQRQYYVFIMTLLGSNLAGVLTTQKNVPHFQEIFTSVMRGINSTDISTQKACFGILRRMVEEWATPTPLPPTGFNEIVYYHIIPVLFKTPLAPTFDLQDGVTNNVLGEILKLLKLVATKCGDPCVSYLVNSYLPQQLECPPELANQFGQHLVNNNQKAFQDFFKNFIKWKKGTR